MGPLGVCVVNQMSVDFRSPEASVILEKSCARSSIG